jgi:hydroxymethylglutaryl-CoA reductase
MAFQFSAAARNASIDAIETAAGTAPTLEIRSGTVPATAATADAGTLLASITLPSDWLAAASGGSKSRLGTWSGTAAAAGTAGHFRIKQGATTHIQGTVTGTGGGGDMTLVNTSLAVSQPITIDTFTLTAGGA